MRLRRSSRPRTRPARTGADAPPAAPAPAAKPPADSLPRPLRVAAAFTWRVLVVAAGVYGVLWLMGYFSGLVIPFLIALLLAALLLPLVRLLGRWMPHALAVTGSFLLAIVVLAGLFTLVGTSIAGQLNQLTSQALEGFTKLQAWLAEGPLQINNEQISQYVEQLQEQVSANGERIASGALTATATAGEFLTGLVLALFTLVFLLLNGEQIWRFFVGLLPANARQAADTAGRAGWESLTQYVRATVMVAAVDAVGIGVGAALLGVPLAVPLAVLVFLGAFVPIVGALVSGAVAVLVALLALGWVQALVMLGIVLLVQQVESNVLQPLIMGRMVSVHPLAVVFAIGAGITVSGIVGAVIAVPVVAVLNTMIRSLSTGGAALDQIAVEHPRRSRPRTGGVPGSQPAGRAARRNGDRPAP